MKQANELKEPGFFEEVFNASPSPLFVVDDDVCIMHFNHAAGLLLGPEGEQALLRRGGEVLHCLHAGDHPDGCGRGEFCADCVVRAAVGQALQGQRVYRRRADMVLLANSRAWEKKFLVTASPFTHYDQRLVLLGLEDISELLALRRLIPICATCKKVRNDEGYWQGVEAYFRDQLDMDFTHGICPECMTKYYPDM